MANCANLSIARQSRRIGVTGRRSPRLPVDAGTIAVSRSLVVDDGDTDSAQLELSAEFTSAVRQAVQDVPHGVRTPAEVLPARNPPS